MTPTNQEIAAEAVDALRQRGLHRYADAVEAQGNATGHYLDALRTIAALAEYALEDDRADRQDALSEIRDKAKEIDGEVRAP
jgi:hypothetical protein